jgi:hypothetical protein
MQLKLLNNIWPERLTNLKDVCYCRVQNAKSILLQLSCIGILDQVSGYSVQNHKPFSMALDHNRTHEDLDLLSQLNL